MNHLYHATPYDISASGFYFSTYDEYLAKAASHRNAHGQLVEEYEIQFIDGDYPRLFAALGVNQANLADWFESFEAMADDEAVKAIYLAEIECVRMEDACDRLDDVLLFEGTVLDWTEQYLEDSGLRTQLPEALRYYIDVDAFARDLVLGGDVTTFEVNGTYYVVQVC